MGRKFTRAVVVIVLAVAIGGAFGGPVSAANGPQYSYDHFGEIATLTGGKTVKVLAASPSQAQVTFTQTDNKGQEYSYTAVVGGDYAPSSVEVNLRWTLCSHPADVTIVSQFPTYDEFGNPVVDEFGDIIFEDGLAYTVTGWTGGFFMDSEGELIRPGCGYYRQPL